MLLIFSTLQIIDLGGIITEINTIKATILIIATKITTITLSNGEKSVMFIAKKVVT